MSWRVSVLLVSTVIGGAWALGGCGTSYQTRYDADVHFARCYRYDADQSVTREARLTCWSAWRSGFPEGQSRDREEHAARRVSQLERGDSAGDGPVVSAHPPPPTPTALRASAPAPARADAKALTAGDPPGLTSTQLCQRDCGLSFTSCVERCDRLSCMQKCGDLAKMCISECL